MSQVPSTIRMSHAGTSAIAHSEACGIAQPLSSHLNAVASLAEQHAAVFGAGQLARWAGLWHDLGKLHPDFQKYLNGVLSRGPEHKLAGTFLAYQYSSPLEMVIYGHHGGLPARHDLRSLLSDPALKTSAEQIYRLAEGEGLKIIPDVQLTWPEWARGSSRELILRMVFSALVDADYLDTERHFSPERAEERQREFDLADLWNSFQRYHATLEAPNKDVARVRSDAYEACLAAAHQPPGFFRLAVPTGGGKTLSSLAFALRHAIRHGLRRLIFAIPYTSIIEQTADVYRRALGPDGIVEHHSAVWQPDDDGGKPSWAKLASENWDAPVVVTTTVQFFESLFSELPSRCRKLHRIAKSVIVVDEVQTLPPRLLQPILDVLTELVEHYGCSVVLCTATQPALAAEDSESIRGLRGARSIIADEASLFSKLQRVRFERFSQWPATWDEIAHSFHQHKQVLAVVNTKADALKLMQAVGDNSVLHLSTLMCGAHRRDVLREIRTRLSGGHPCRVVTTQVIEAGVDVDFPVVFRAVGPLDRIVQAAGRCNREGKLPDRGRVIVFDPVDGGLPSGAYRAATDLAREFLDDPDTNLHDPAVYRDFFAALWQQVSTNPKELADARKAFDYPEIARLFRLIDDDGVPVVVRYRSSDGKFRGAELLAELHRPTYSPRSLMRRLQPWLVNVRQRSVPTLERDGLLIRLTDGLYEWAGQYGNRGLICAGDPEHFII